jgi:TRAP-type C4-dicarboxylate transport system permease large subunit
MPLGVAYLLALLIFMSVVFLFLKRPIYEVMAISYVFVIIITRRFDMFWQYAIQPSKSGLFYTIVGFLALAHIFGETKVVEKIINFVIATVGRFRGGGGYVSLIASTFMAALSGTGPGNVAATGVFTIPAMKKTGFSSELAATVEMSCSSLGNMIPPSGIIVLCYGIYNTLYPDQISLANFWLVVWGIAIWFIAQRWLTLLGFCWYYKVDPIPEADRPPVGKSFLESWQALLIPVLIFGPIYLGAKMDTTVAARLGAAGARLFNTHTLLFTPGLAAAYGLFIARKSVKSINLKGIYEMLKSSVATVTPVAATIYIAFAISAVFGKLGMEQSVQQWFISMGLTRVSIAIILPIFCMFLGMVLPGSSQVAILGGALVAAFAAFGGNPLLIAATLPAITGAMEGMTPPLALCMYAAMGIADSKFKETAKLAYIWIGLHAVTAIIVLLGIVPILWM